MRLKETVKMMDADALHTESASYGMANAKRSSETAAADQNCSAARAVHRVLGGKRMQ